MPYLIDEREALNAALRQDFTSFVWKCFSTLNPTEPFYPNWHIDAIAWHLEACLEGRIKRLIITMPPRSLKSICASVGFPAWVLGHDPSRKIVCVSYANELTVRHARDCRAVLESTWYRAIFPRTRLNPQKNTELEFETLARGFRYGTSVGGTLTGRGGNLIIIDDPLKPLEAMSETKRDAVNQWYDGTLYSRLDSKADDCIIIIMQRLHIDDLVGHVLEQEPWVQLSLPAIAENPERIQIGHGSFVDRAPGDLLHPTRETLKVLEVIRETLGTYNFSAQYQQNPTPEGGTLIKWDWFRIYHELPNREGGDRIVQSWDTASKADELHDFSVCTTWLEQKHNYYLIDVFRRRLEYPELKRQVVQQAIRHGAQAVLIEDKGSGIHLIQDLQRDGSLRPIAILPEGDKLTRMASQTAKIEAGYVLLPEHASWLSDFQIEMMQFPNGRHDDQVDSVAQFLAWASRQVVRPRISSL